MLTNFDAIVKVAAPPLPDAQGKYIPNVLYIVNVDDNTFTLMCTSTTGDKLKTLVLPQGATP